MKKTVAHLDFIFHDHSSEKKQQMLKSHMVGIKEMDMCWGGKNWKVDILVNMFFDWFKVNNDLRQSTKIY